MFSKSQNWLRHSLKSARIKYAAVLSFVVLLVLFGVVQASGPMRPMPPHGPGMGQMGPGMGMWGKMKHYWYPTVPVPTIKILAVVQDESVTFETMNFPADEDFTVTMGRMYTRGINGIEVGTFNSGDGSSSQETFPIPADLHGNYKISIRASTDHMYPYYAFNWFYNNTTEAVAAPAATVEETTEEAAEETSEETTAEETAEETTEAAEETTEGAAGGGSELVGHPWQWEEFTDPVSGTQAVDNPEKYLIEFLAEGGINIQADCNIGNGTYMAEEDGGLSISVTAMTLALCEEDSLSDPFVNSLSASAVYFFADGYLYIDLFADSGTMKFAPFAVETGEADTAEGEVGTGGAEGEATTEETEEAAPAEGEATTEETEEAAPAEGEAPTEETGTEEAYPAEGDAASEETEEAAPSEGEEAPSLTGNVWQWSEFTDPVQGTISVDNPEVYTAEFLEDGSVNVQADCNSGRGNYTVDGSSITISELAMTRALCAPESLSDLYVEYLTAAAIYFFEDANLFLDLPADSGTMMFVAAETEPAAALARGRVFKTALQGNGEEEDPVPSFIVCTVVKDETVTVVTENFPAGEEFRVQMGVMPEPMPMPYYHGPTPYKEPYPMPMPYGQGSMGPSMGPSMQPSMGPGMGPSMGPSMQPSMGPPPMGKPNMKGMWGKPMGGQKVWIPYYDAGTLDSGDGGSLNPTFEIPAELAGTYRISILVRTDHQYPYYAYNWFYNNDAEVCNGNGNG